MSYRPTWQIDEPIVNIILGDNSIYIPKKIGKMILQYGEECGEHWLRENKSNIKTSGYNALDTVNYSSAVELNRRIISSEAWETDHTRQHTTGYRLSIIIR
jgi:hypothetical protein